MVGTIDTAVTPIHYSGDGEIGGVDLNRFGEALDVAWLRDPRYAGTVSGRFRVDGAGSELATLALTADGRFSRADLFRGVLIGRGRLARDRPRHARKLDSRAGSTGSTRRSRSRIRG